MRRKAQVYRRAQALRRVMLQPQTAFSASVGGGQGYTVESVDAPSQAAAPVAEQTKQGGS